MSVCASALPVSVASPAIVIAVLSNITPWKLTVEGVVDPRAVTPPTTQKMLLADAPPVRMTWTPLLTVKVPPIWKMKTPLPEMVKLLLARAVPNQQ